MTKSTPHLGLARKYRPQSFDDVIGQEAVTVTLKNAIASGKPSHAYLFFGPRGTGKTTTARILAKALNCGKGSSAEPCGVCGPCSEIALSADLDVLELDAATHTQVEKIREMILETVSLAPARDRHKVFIIDEVHMLSTSSFNALLKTLEEPPPHVVFILATTEPAKIPATIVSRCQRFRFRPLPVETIQERLSAIAEAEGVEAEPAALQLLARAAGGALRDAVGLLDQAQAFGEAEVRTPQVMEMLGTLPEDALLALAAAIVNKDAPALGRALDGLLEAGYDPAQIARDLRERLQAAFLHRLGVRSGVDEAWQALAAPHGPQAFSYLVGRLNQTLERLRVEDSPRLVLEQALFGTLEPAIDLAQWVERLETLEKRLADPAPALPPLEPRPAAKAAATAPEPVRSSLPGPPENVWPAVIQGLREEKPVLAANLEAARLLPQGKGNWRLLFRRPFDLEQAKRSLEAIEAKLSSIVGHAVLLDLEVAAGKGARTAAAPEEPAEPAPAEEPAVEDPVVKKVLEVFPGTVRQLKGPAGRATDSSGKKS